MSNHIGNSAEDFTRSWHRDEINRTGRSKNNLFRILSVFRYHQKQLESIRIFAIEGRDSKINFSLGSIRAYWWPLINAVITVRGQCLKMNATISVPQSNPKSEFIEISIAAIHDVHFREK